MDNKKYNEAVRVFSSLVAQNPTIATLYEQRAIAYNELSIYDSAITDIDFTIRLSPQNISSVFLRGQIKHNANRFKEAISDFDFVILNKPDFNEAYLSKGVILLKLNKKNEACENFGLALKYGNRQAQTFIDENCN